MENKFNKENIENEIDKELKNFNDKLKFEVDPISNLKDFFEVDENKKLVLVKYKYEKATDLFKNEISSKFPIIKEDFYLQLEDIFKMLPKGYKVSFIFEIKDKCGYSNLELEKIFFTNIEFRHFSHFKSTKSKKIISYLLLLFGIIILLLKISFISTSIIKLDELAKNIIDEVLDIAAWVFIWEAVTIYFFDISSMRFKKRALEKKIYSFKFN